MFSIFINLIIIAIQSFLLQGLVIIGLILATLCLYAYLYFRSTSFNSVRENVMSFTGNSDGIYTRVGIPTYLVNDVPWVIRRLFTKEMWKELDLDPDIQGKI